MVVQQQGNHVLIASRATAVRHPVQRPRPALLSASNVDLKSSHNDHDHGLAPLGDHRKIGDVDKVGELESEQSRHNNYR